jgi:hypothetical protein
MGLAVRLTDLGIERFGVCQAPGCLGVFIDVSSSNTRRYCSERCMNRANVSAFRARKRGEDEADSKTPGATAQSTLRIEQVMSQALSSSARGFAVYHNVGRRVVN